MNGLSLCSGIGGLDLGLKRAVPGYRTVCYVEYEAYPQDVLLARMADGLLDPAPVWGDLKQFDAKPWRGLVDVVHGGYPCQPFSVAGKRLGGADPRHLWPDFARVVRECEPEWCFFENVAGHLRLGFDVVARDLVDMGYRVAAGLFTAAEVGAPHKRQRLYILAHQERDAVRDERRRCGGPRGEGAAVAGDVGSSLADSLGARRQAAGFGRDFDARPESEARGGSVGDADDSGLEGRRERHAVGPDQRDAWPPGPEERDRWDAVLERRPELAPAVADANNPRRGGPPAHLPLWREGEGIPDVDGTSSGVAEAAAVPEPIVRGMADGPAHRMDRLKALGNAVVPACAAHAWTALLSQL